MKHKNKLLFPLFAAASFLLAGCSSGDIIARPSWMNDSIITNIVTKDNTMKVVYDAIKNLGSTNSDLLNKTLYDIALKSIGNYKTDNSTKGLAVFAHGVRNTDYTDSDINAFVAKYPIYKCKMEKGVVNGQEQVLTDSNKIDISLAYIQETYKAIEEAVYEALYNEIKGGTYSYGITKDFNEEEYVWNLYKNMNLRKNKDGKYITVTDINTKLKTIHNDLKLSNKTSGIHFTYRKNHDTFEKYVEYDLSNAPTYKSGFLIVKRALNSDETELVPTKYVFDSYIYGPYIEKKIIPDIYRNLLIQNYVNEQRYPTLGRSYARKVNEITVDANTKDESVNICVETLFKNFAKANITDETSFGVETLNYDVLEKCIRGYDIADVETSLTSAGFKALKTINDRAGSETAVKYKIGTADAFQVYKGTKFGDLMEKLILIKNAPESGDWSTATDREVLTKEAQDALKDLTNSGAHSLETGIQLKINEILATSFTKDGWQTKSTMTDLSDDSKNRLFNISASNVLDNNNKTSKGYESFDENNDYAVYFKYKDSVTPGAKTVAPKAFLTPKTLVKDYKAEDTVVISDKKKISIVQIEDAVSTSKLSLTSKNNYINLKSGTNVTDSIIEMNKIVQGVAKAVSAGDTYKKNADQYYLMISNIIIHDTSVYNYFKQQFPDLFK